MATNKRVFTLRLSDEVFDKMAQNLGELIDKENELLKGAIKNVTAKQK